MKPHETHPDAADEVRHAYAWYEEQRSGLGLELLTELEAQIHLIEADPGGGSPHTRPPFRYRTLKRFPYSVYFTELDDVVWIAAVVHHSRRPDYWKRRSRG